MSHKIILPIRQLEQEFEDLLDFMALNYHNTRYNTPSDIPDYGPMTAEEQAEFDAYEGIGNTAFSAETPGRKSKRTIFHGDADFCNGLPRPKR